MSITLPRLARRRLLRRPGLAAAMCLGLAAALGLTATVLVAQAMATEAGLRRTLAATAGGGAVTITTNTPRDARAYDAFQSDADRRTSAALGARIQPVVAFAAMASVGTWTVNGQRFDANPTPTNPAPPRPALAYTADLARHVRLVQGTLPADEPTDGDHPIAVLESEPFGLKVGDRMCLGFLAAFGGTTAQATYPVCLRVAAIYRQVDPRGAYWQGRAIDRALMASRADVYDGLLAINRANRIAGAIAVAARVYRVPVASIDAGSAADLARRLHQLHGYYAIRTDATFATDVDSAIDGFLDRQRIGAYTVQLVAAALVLVALFALSFVARHFLDGQASELAALRARGWRRRRVLAFLLLQLGTLLAAAVPLGVGLAALAGLALARVAFPPPPPGLVAADLTGIAILVAGAVAAAALLLGALAVLAARRDVLELRRGVSRPGAPAWWRWRGADLALAAVAVPLLAESRLRGSDQVRAAGAADDPLSLLLPGLALAMLAVAGLRLLPVLTRVALRGARGVPGRLAGWQLARRPVQHASLALLVTFAVAVGVFSSVYATTDRRNAIDRAGYQAGADVRAEYAPPEPRLDLLRSTLPRSAVTSEALRVQALPGSLTGISSTVLGIDPASIAGVGWVRPQSSDPPVADLARTLQARDPDGLDLPGRPRTFSVWTWYDGDQGQLSADLSDAGGHSGTLDLGPPERGGWRRLSAPVRFDGEDAPTYPVRLKRLVLRGPAHGSLAFSDLAADDRVVEPFDHADGWWALETHVSQTAPRDLKPSTTVSREGRPATTVNVQLPNGSLTIQPEPSQRPVPAVVSSALLRDLGIGLEQPFPLHLDTGPVQVTAVRSVDTFPTLYPDDRFLVVPLDALLDRTARDDPGQILPNELWVRGGGRPDALAARLRDAGFAREVDDRAALQTAALSDPMRVALDGTLAVGFLATIGVAVLAFGIHFLAAARARLQEYAILRANGLSAGHVGRSLLLEQGVLLVHGLVVGGALGLVVAFVVLPAVQLGGTPADLVPPTVVTVDPAGVGGAALTVLAGGLLGGWLARRAAARVDVREQLRQLG